MLYSFTAVNAQLLFSSLSTANATKYNGEEYFDYYAKMTIDIRTTGQQHF